MALQSSVEETLLAAWKYCAPAADTSQGFPRGFWPDLARVALEMERQETLTPELSFRPTACTIGSGTSPSRPKRKVDLSELTL